MKVLIGANIPLVGHLMIVAPVIIWVIFQICFLEKYFSESKWYLHYVLIAYATMVSVALVGLNKIRGNKPPR